MKAKFGVAEGRCEYVELMLYAKHLHLPTLGVGLADKHVEREHVSRHLRCLPSWRLKSKRTAILRVVEKI